MRLEIRLDKLLKQKVIKQLWSLPRILLNEQPQWGREEPLRRLENIILSLYPMEKRLLSKPVYVVDDLLTLQVEYQGQGHLSG